MDQKVISEDDLVKIINGELEKHEECIDCKVNGVMKLQESDEMGCNWSDPYIQCSGVPAEVCTPVANRVISHIRQKYNLT